MHWLTKIHRRLRILLRKDSVEREMEEEIDFHLEMEIEENLRRGMTLQEARRAAMVSFGGVERFKERAREERGGRLLEEAVQDSRYALRSMWKRPAYSVVVVFTLALGIGGTTAIFSIVSGVLLRPLPYPDAERIVYLTETNLSRGWPSFTVSPLNFRDWHAQNRSMELMAAYRRTTLNYTGGERPLRLTVYQVTEDFLEILGGEPVLGRGFTDEDMLPAREGVVLLDHAFWEESFGADPGVLGRIMLLEGEPHTIIGVLPDGWRHPFDRSGAEILVPVRPQTWWRRFNHFLLVLGRTHPGVSVEQAQADLTSVAAALAVEYPDSNAEWGARVRSLDEVLLGRARPQLLVLLVSVGLVLLIGCVNVAQMTLARGSARDHEMAVRTALGARRGRIIRQLLSESLVLSLLGGSLGVLLAAGCLWSLFLLWPQVLPRMGEVEIDGSILFFAAGASLASGLLTGLFPALRVTGSRLGEAFQRSRSGVTATVSLWRLRGALVAVEMSLAMVLLIGSGLLIRSFATLLDEDPGFHAEDRLAIPTPLSASKYPTREDRQAYGEAALERLSAIPGVESVVITSLIPVTGEDQIGSVRIDGRPMDNPDDDISVLAYSISPGYLETMGIPLLAGREFTWDDRSESGLVAVVSESFARTHFPGEDAVGRLIRFGGANNPPTEIVGVAGEVQHYRLGRTAIPQAYLPFTQWLYAGDFNFVIKATVPPLSLVPAVRTEIQAVAPDMPVEGVRTLEKIIADDVSTPRFRTMLLTSFSLTALILAVVGMYGVMSYMVTQRWREIGMRMALGADRSRILEMVLKNGIPPVLAGTAIGLGGALALTRVLESMLFGVGIYDPGVFVSVPLLLVAVALLAMMIPALKATRVDPVKALSSE